MKAIKWYVSKRASEDISYKITKFQDIYLFYTLTELLKIKIV